MFSASARAGAVRSGAAALAAALALLAAACGGGGSDTSPPPNGLVDTTAYSTAPAASLDSADEAASVTAHEVVVAGQRIAYSATIGHLTARNAGSGVAEASMFYVAYTVAAPGSPRPLIVFFNGGPGSATVWLHLGSFAPRRIVIGAPSLAIPQPFQLVDNAESLIDVADLVFVDAVGSGYSEALAPFNNQSFWSVDGDAALMRDFIARYAAASGRSDVPTFVLGESYGTTRAAVLADLMVAAGMRLDGVILQSSILDYNANCDVFATDQLSCAGNLPSYGLIGAWYGLVAPAPAGDDAYAAQMRSFAATSYAPAIDAFLHGTPVAPALLDQLSALTGAPRSLWAADPDLGAESFRRNLLPGRIAGRYDARIAAANGTPLAASGDPSAAIINAPFAAAARSLFSNELGYTASAGYTLLSNAIDNWHFDHDGRALPDVIPDLAAALAQRPALRVLSLAGYHDLATPFWQTERDLGRLADPATYAVRVYAGGHMTYLDDAARPRQKADIVAFLAAATPMRAESAPPGGAASASATRAASAGAAPPTPSPAAAAIPAAPTAAPSGAVAAPDRAGLAQGGDPVLPARLRVAPREPSPTGAALAALVARKIAEQAAAGAASRPR